MRVKEEAHDYRYFPDPDLAPYVITNEMLENRKTEMVLLPKDLRKVFIEEYKLSANEALILADNIITANLLIELVNLDVDADLAARWLTGPVKALINQVENSQFKVDSRQLSKLIQLVEDNKVTSTNAINSVLPELVNGMDADTLQLVSTMNLSVEDDESSLSEIIDEVLIKYPEEVDSYKKGKKVLLQLFMGQVMKKTQGKADPKITMKLIKHALSNEK